MDTKKKTLIIVVCILVALLTGIIGFVIGKNVERFNQKVTNRANEITNCLGKLSGVGNAFDKLKEGIENASGEDVDNIIDSFADNIKDALNDEKYSDTINDIKDSLKDALKDEDNREKISEAIDSFKERISK